MCVYVFTYITTHTVCVSLTYSILVEWVDAVRQLWQQHMLENVDIYTAAEYLCSMLSLIRRFNTL